MRFGTLFYPLCASLGFSTRQCVRRMNGVGSANTPQCMQRRKSETEGDGRVDVLPSRKTGDLSLRREREKDRYVCVSV